ncbi:hypothetical protein BJV74DRAFT_799168 [Russula compacta]|nr:hypothetical protein BJV74DRAFT_799168 [Russula compacta]
MLFSVYISAYALVGLAISAPIFAAPARMIKRRNEDLYGRDGLSPIARDAAPAGEGALENTEELFLRALYHAHAGRDVPTTTTVVVIPSLSQVNPGSTTILIVPTASGSPSSSAVTVTPDPAAPAASESPSSTVLPITLDLAASDPSDDACGSASAGSDAAAILPILPKRSLGLNTYASRTLQKRQNSSCTSSTRSTGKFWNNFSEGNISFAAQESAPLGSYNTIALREREILYPGWLCCAFHVLATGQNAHQNLFDKFEQA